MNEERRVTLRYLIDMYSGIFDDDVIEAVLEHRDWNTDRALDDLMVMAQGCSFNIPVDDSPGEQLTSNFHPGDPLSQQINFTSHNNEIENEEKAESEDDIIVVNEEEFCLSGESESEDEKSPAEQPNTVAPIQPPSYASVAKQPPTYQEISHVKPPSIVFTGYTSFERKKRTRDSIERVKLFVRQGFKIIVILRGCPGSGKTTLAKSILAGCNLTKNPYWYIHSTDNYWHLNEQGTYQRDASKLDEAHRWNQVNILHVIREGLTPIIVDNTCVRMWEMEAYSAMAVYAGYEIEVVEPDSSWAFHATQLARKNVHGVSREHIMMLLKRYDYNVSSSLLLKSFNLEYAPGMAPPQVGVRELSNKELISRFEDLYNTLHVYPKQLKKLKKQQKPSRKARKKQRQLEDKNLDDIVSEIENCGKSADNEDDESVKSIDLSNEVAQAFASQNLAEDSDSDKSWEDLSDESEVSVESPENTSDESDDEDDESESSSSGSESEEISENEIDETVAAELAPIENTDASSDEKEKEIPEILQNPDDPGSMRSVNVMVDSFRNPMNLDANEVSVEITENTRNKFSNRLYDALSKSNPRLKCFEMFHGEELPRSYEDLVAMGEEIVNVSDPSILQSIKKIIDEETSPATALVPEIINSETPDVILQNILNNTLPPIGERIKPAISLDIALDTVTTPLESPQLFETSLTNDLVRSDNSTINDTGFSEVDDAIEWRRADDGLSKLENATDLHFADPFQDANDTLNSSLATPEVTVIYNEPEKVTDKSNKSLKNANAGNSTDDDRNSLLNEAKRITGNVDSESSYKNNLNEGDDSLVEEFDQIVSSSKFKDETEMSSSLIRSIENDLWGDNRQDNACADVDRNICTSENSENSDYGSNSSSSDELRIEDVHNSVNRFVNNDIKSDQAAEKKKQNIDLKNINADDDIMTVELNTLKERILVNSLDKVLNQRNVEDQDGESELKAINISRKSSLSGFQMIENKLNEKSEVNIERNDLFDEYASRDETDTIEDRTESKFWNQWMKGGSWDDAADKDKPVDAKPPRKHDSPSKQKNTETSSIRLVNDIKTDKNKNQPAQKLKTINFEPMMNDYFKYRSYPNAEDSLFGLPAAYDAKLKNVNVNESKDSYYALNTMPKRANDEGSDEGEKKSTWSFPDNTDYEASSYVDARRSPYRNFPKNYDMDLQFLEKQDKDWPSSEKNTKNDDALSFEPKPHRRSAKKKVEDKTPEFVNELVQRWKSIAKEESPPDYDKVLKWSPLNDVDVEWKDDEETTLPSCDRKPQRSLGELKRNPFTSYALTQKKDQTTNTGTDDVTGVQYRAAYCREINNDRESPIVNAIEQKMRCNKSTMTNGSSYTVKAKPIKEDLLNMFPKGMADSILDLYEKCNGCVYTIIETLRDDEYSPTEDQLNYLMSLDNVASSEEESPPDYDKVLKRSSLNDVDVAWKDNEETTLPSCSSDGESPPKGRPYHDRYRTKVKPIKEDLLKMFPNGIADSILDLFEKCKGCVPWIITILRDDGYFPTNDQFEYLISLDNVASSEEESPPDYDKVLKRSPLNDVDVAWKNDEETTLPSCDRKSQRSLGELKENPFTSYALTPNKDQTTNTGTDDVTDVQYRAAYCREINNDRESPIVNAIEQKMRCDKSTMTNGSSYTVKAKPIKEDLLNMFPKGMADSILDLYEKCNGNMDWIIEILMEDGYSPTDDQLEYLSSLQNVASFEDDVAKENEKQLTSEKKKKSNGNGKNIRRNNSHFKDNKKTDFSKKIKRKKIDFKDEKRSPDEYAADTLLNGELDDEESPGSVELFLDTTTVQQLVGYFGNPTVYSLKDCQPVVNLPVSLARQIHAYLLESVIDQAESNESLINQLAEDEIMAGQIQSMEHVTEVSQNDMIEVENSLCDLINLSEPTTPSATSEDSFASKLSLDLLLKSFPTVDPSFVCNTFRSNKCNYYETKKVLNQIRPEVPTNLSFNLNEEKLVDLRTNDVPQFESVSMPRTEVLDQVNSYRDDAAFNYEQWQKFNEQLKTTIQRKRFGVAPYYRELMGAFKQKFDECNAKAAAVLINSCCANNSNVIDLHFFRVTEALQALDMFLDHHISRLANAARPKTTLYIITGRGARNGDGVSHLQPPIKSRLKKRNVEFDVQPSNTGMVVAVVRKSSLLTRDL